MSQDLGVRNLELTLNRTTEENVQKIKEKFGDQIIVDVV
jgi:hypothetical protein